MAFEIFAPKNFWLFARQNRQEPDRGESDFKHKKFARKGLIVNSVKGFEAKAKMGFNLELLTQNF